MSTSNSAVGAIFIALLGGAIKTSTPYLFVSLGETLTEKAGRVNLGLEGTLMMGAVTGFGASLFSGNPFVGVLAAGGAGLLMGALHAWLCSFRRVSSIAVGIALMIFGTGLAFYLGKPLIQPQAPHLPAIDLGFWTTNPALKEALQINVLFIAGVVLAPLLAWFLASTRWGLILRLCGENVEAARAKGIQPERVRLLATAAGGFLAGIGGSFLSLYYPGTWTEGLSTGQGLLAVALVIFSRWNPLLCLVTSLLFGALGSLGAALQAAGLSQGFYLFGTVPALMALGLMILTSGKKRGVSGRPAELSVHT
ncbi:MAG: ABC transporter permease [Spirochaetales bacterium]|nr:ABC transporter permease [Spirochaetales bacterium]